MQLADCMQCQATCAVHGPNGLVLLAGVDAPNYSSNAAFITTAC